VIEVMKRVLAVAVLALAVVGSAVAASPLRGVVVGTGNGLVFVATPSGKVTMIRGHAKIGARVVLKQGRLVVLARPQHLATRTTVNGVRRNDDDRAEGAKIEIEGVVAAVGAGTVTLNVGGQMLTVQLPMGVAIPASFVGRADELELEFAAPGVVIDDDDANDEHGDVVTTPPPTSGHDGGDDHGGGGHGGSGRH